MSEKNGIDIIPQSPVSKKIIGAIAEKYKPVIAKEGWPKTIEHLLSREDKPSDIPPNCAVKSDKKLKIIDGCNVYEFTKNENYDSIILYLHGGAYVYDIYENHVGMCDDLAQRTGFKVCLPCYPLAPQHAFGETYKLLDKIYDMLLSENKRIVLIGDSAGGGLALAYSLYLKKKSVALPEKLVLISPFVDITLSNPDVDEYDKKDVMLKKYRLLECGKFWAGKTSPNDYRLSPINENLDGLPPTLIFAGDSELMYPDSVRLHEKLKKSGVDSRLVIGEGMIHVFVLIEMLPEAAKCRDVIHDFVRRSF